MYNLPELRLKGHISFGNVFRHLLESFGDFRLTLSGHVNWLSRPAGDFSVLIVKHFIDGEVWIPSLL